MNIRDIIAGAILDGQNQIHDLRSERATPSEITDRMFKSVDYWEKKALGVESVEPTPTEEKWKPCCSALGREDLAVHLPDCHEIIDYLRLTKGK